MSTSGILIEQTLSIFIILLTGVICYRTKLIDDDSNKKLTNILLTLAQPILIFTSFQMDFDIDLVVGLLISLVLAFATHIVAIIISYIFIRKKKRKIIIENGVRTVTYVVNEDAEVERLTGSYANMGLMGMPIIYGIYGSVGVFYVTAYIIAFNILMYTHGVIMISGNRNLKFRDIIDRFKSPAIIAIISGIIFFVFQIKLPKVIYQSLDNISRIYAPFGMIIAGATIAKTDLIKMLTGNLRRYYIVFLKLLLVPFVTMLIYVWLPIDETIKMVAIILSATPTTTIGTLLTIKYNKNSVFAAEVFAMTTLFSIVTIPFIIMIAELLM
jgi:predicted permease